MIRITQAVFALALMSVVAVGAADLKGRIVDDAGDGLPGANLTILSGDESVAGAVSGATGDYVVRGLSAGTYDVRITHIGYRAIIRADVVIGAGATALDVSLQRTVLDLEQQVVSASRTQEKALDAPASISIVEAAEMETRSALSVSEMIRDQPGVDFAKTGLVQSNVVARGFNNIFSGALLTLTDNRIASVPSLRLNAYNFLPQTNADIERIEIVLGPGAALYGPNSANGVMHVITRSPLTSPGTSVQFGMGERGLRKGTIRHAGLISPELGYKISAQYYVGEDWQGYDREEAGFAATDVRGNTVTGLEVNSGKDTTLTSIRDFDIERQSLEARIDYKPSDDLTGVLTYGYNSGDFIELTGLGAGQGQDWTYNYVQARIIYRDWFAQFYRNWSDAGDTFLLRSGGEIVDKSSFQVFQVQHSAKLGDRQRFIYGIDALLTRPDTEGSITGANEDDDNIDEYGAYIQSSTDLRDDVEVVLALRYDDHNRLVDQEVSPRAALVYKPSESQTLRLTYNRAFSTPTTNNLYLDLLSSGDPFGLGSAFAPSLGFAPAIDVRAQGTFRDGFEDGFTFRRGAGDEPMYRSPFTPVLQAQLAALGLQPGSPGYSVDADGFIAMHDPVATTVQWNIGRGAVLAQLAPALEGLVPSLVAQQLVAQGIDAATAQAVGEAQAAQVVAALPSMVPTQLPNLRNTLATLNTQTFGFDPVDNAFDVPRASSTITQTLEIGYKGIIGSNFVVSADIYRSDVENFVGPLRIETPNVFLDPNALAAELVTAFGAALADPANAEVAAVLGALDQISVPGVSAANNNGTAADEMATVFAAGAAQIPYGTVSPEQAFDPTAILLTYRSFGDVTLYGADVSLAYYPTQDIGLSASYSLVNDDLFIFPDFAGSSDTVNVALNAPKQKFKLGVDYALPQFDTRLGARLRYNGGFPQESGVYSGDVDSYTLVDLSARYELPFATALHLLVNIDNVLDKSYQAFVGAPEVGRLAYLQLGVDF